ncbi:hypothetical protein [Coralloluteibacterium stylophorae]|uniref:Uncharacterized protein n=2 Tax=Gammaproteobacteria TaxID=1236 RepID=A0A8J7VR25_9GAMM|nr:hypothetical protein [Coralloluteibacterium stylophorae]MBS7457450.1 hypothetical protein [Coralloluteibacterium stylophorae]
MHTKPLIVLASLALGSLIAAGVGHSEAETVAAVPAPVQIEHVRTLPTVTVTVDASEIAWIRAAQRDGIQIMPTVTVTPSQAQLAALAMEGAIATAQQFASR